VNRKVPSTRPRPSYEEGELRDKRIEALQDGRYEQKDLLALVKQSVQQVKGKRPSSA
jgi:hypothetical protein